MEEQTTYSAKETLNPEELTLAEEPALASKDIMVSLKIGHPTGVYHRCGFTFLASAPTAILKADMKKLNRDDRARLRSDIWLKFPEGE